MTEPNIVQFVETNLVGIPRVRDDAFSYQPARGWKFFQRLCFKFLARLHCQHRDETVEITRVIVDRRATMEEIFRQQMKLGSELGRGGEILLIGSADWSEIMKTRALQYSPMAFDGDYYVSRIWDDGRHDKMKKKLRVCVIPWMKGMVLVPKEALQGVVDV